MNKITQLLAIGTLVVAPFALADVAHGQAVDDGPCPQGTVDPATLFAQGAVDYDGAAWTVDGHVVGYSAEEDECMRVVSDDLDPAPAMPQVRQAAGLTAEPVRTPVRAQDPTSAGLPVTL